MGNERCLGNSIRYFYLRSANHRLITLLNVFKAFPNVPFFLLLQTPPPCYLKSILQVVVLLDVVEMWTSCPKKQTRQLF